MAKGLSHNCVQKCGSPDGFSLLLIFCVWNDLYFALVKFFYSDGQWLWTCDLVCHWFISRNDLTCSLCSGDHKGITAVNNWFLTKFHIVIYNFH